MAKTPKGLKAKGNGRRGRYTRTAEAHERLSPGGKRLDAWLEKKGMSQLEFARLLGKQHPIITGWLYGKFNPSPSNALLIEDATDGAIPITAWYVSKQTIATSEPLERAKRRKVREAVVKRAATNRAKSTKKTAKKATKKATKKPAKKAAKKTTKK